MACGAVYTEFPAYVQERYEIGSVIGEGAYGVVWSARDRTSRSRVAIKRLRPFSTQERCVRALREMHCLQQYNHKNIVALRDIPLPTHYNDFCELYLVQEWMPHDLHYVIQKSVLSTRGLPPRQYKNLMYQLLQGLKAIHSNNILHRDLKPSNLLVDADGILKIADFGLARPLASTQRPSNKLTEYVVTRWYRAPEIMLCPGEYNYAMDVWSAGCILGEMLFGQPMFPGRHYIDQIRKILSFTGMPSDEYLSTIKAKGAVKYLVRLQIPQLQLNAVNISVDARNLLAHMLHFNPAERSTIDQALEHRFFEDFHQPLHESCNTVTTSISGEDSAAWEHEDPKMLKKLMWNTIKFWESHSERTSGSRFGGRVFAQSW